MKTFILGVLKKNWLFISFIIFFCLIHFLIFFKEGSFVLGGEGNYWYNFKITLMNQGYTWLKIGTGEFTTSINSIFLFPQLFSYINNIRLISYLITISNYLLPFMGMYLLLNYIYKKNRINASLLSFFYIANPFSIIFLVAMNPWNMHILLTYPLFLYIFIRWYDKTLLLFYILGITSSILSYTLTNPPQMALFIIMIPFLLFIASIIKYHKFYLPSYVKNFIVVGVSIFLFNFWWIIHWVIVLPQAQTIYTLKFAQAWLKNQAEVSPMILKDIFSFSWIMPNAPDYSILANYYNHPLIQILMYIPFVLIFVWIVMDMKSSTKKSIISYLFLGMFVLGLFLKGLNPPFRNIISSCFDYVKYCYIFKTAPEKFGVVFTLFSTIILYYIVTDSKKIWFRFAFYFYLLLLFIPFIGGYYLPDVKIDTNDYATRKYVNYPEFQEFQNEMNNHKLDFRLLSLPNSGNYQIKMHLFGNKYYTGHNPVLSNIPQPFIADNSSDAYISLFSRINSPVEAKILGLFSVKYIVFNNRIISWFGNFTGKPSNEIMSILNKNYKKVFQKGQIQIYENSEFIPHFWIPEKIVLMKKTADLNFIFDYLEKHHTENNVAFMPQIFPLKQPKPVVEFKPINATKYRIIIHGIYSRIPLIFNESFNLNWKLYSKRNTDSDNKIKKVDTFISKNISGTIQNNNLPNGELLETDNTNYIKRIEENHHLRANMYANAWIIDPLLCINNWCKRNKDGSYNMELIVEYSQQKIFYKTVMVSLTVFILSSLIFSISIIKKFNRERKHD